MKSKVEFIIMDIDIKGNCIRIIDEMKRYSDIYSGKCADDIRRGAEGKEINVTRK